MQRTTLLRLQCNSPTSSLEGSEPILPLPSSDLATFRASPLSQHRQPDVDEHETASRYAGLGPWVVRCDLRLPDATQGVHPSTSPMNGSNTTERNLRSNVRCEHVLRVIIKVKRDDDEHCDAQGNDRQKLYEISMLAPFTMLSVSKQWGRAPRVRLLTCPVSCPLVGLVYDRANSASPLLTSFSRIN